LQSPFGAQSPLDIREFVKKVFTSVKTGNDGSGREAAREPSEREELQK